MNYFKIINVFFFTAFFLLSLRFYLSDDFDKSKEASRINYLNYLKKYSNDMVIINNKSFKNNIKKFELLEEKDKKFWKLLK
ncbi:MAG: hypothetical protein CMI81_01935 [Candidatus Pelagibacter sp.]|nr:hypothetical protein [Candidatus Pelagibacter sp.]|tara:strand:+ start:263 stop:505 length:243 start_codon:yes stop_codon:yes gene_type:complete